MKQQKKVHRLFVNSELKTDTHTCSNELSHRIMNVLRVKESDELIIFNNNKNQYLAVIDFIKSTYNHNEFIPLHEPRFLGNEKKYLNECIDSTFVSSVGKFVDDFEKKIAQEMLQKKSQQPQCTQNENERSPVQSRSR